MSMWGGIVNVRQTPIAGAGTTAQRPAISVPGFIWINLDTPASPIWQRFDGSTWIDFTASAPTLPAWALAGNTLTGTEIFGSVNDQPVVMRQNNTEVARLQAGTYRLLLQRTELKDTPKFSNNTNAKYFEIVTNTTVPYLRMFNAGVRDVYFLFQNTRIDLCTNVTGTAYESLRVQDLEMIGGSFVMQAATNVINLLGGAAAGNAAYIRFSNTGVEKWIVGVVQGNDALQFRVNATSISTGTLRLEFLRGGGLNIYGTAGQGYNQFSMSEPYTPSSSADANGQTGAMCWDDNYVYVKTSAGWKRSALSAF